jgi:hypothetical protein
VKGEEEGGGQVAGEGGRGGGRWALGSDPRHPHNGPPGPGRRRRAG